MTSTSKNALAYITSTGRRARIRDLVLEQLDLAPAGLTGAEINARVVQGANRRLSELERAGLVYKDGTRECRETGLRAVVWRR
jgi:hypothetical protein